jgi:hypothetical protein
VAGVVARSAMPPTAETTVGSPARSRVDHSHLPLERQSRVHQNQLQRPDRESVTFPQPSLRLDRARESGSDFRVRADNKSGPESQGSAAGAGCPPADIEESRRVADHTPYQRKIIDRYYKNLDAIQFQRLSELATDLYLAEGKKRDRLWTRVEESLRKLEFPEKRIELLLQKRDPAQLVGILKELESGG